MPKNTIECKDCGNNELFYHYFEGDNTIVFECAECFRNIRVEFEGFKVQKPKNRMEWK